MFTSPQASVLLGVQLYSRALDEIHVYRQVFEYETKRNTQEISFKKDYGFVVKKLQELKDKNIFVEDRDYKEAKGEPLEKYKAKQKKWIIQAVRASYSPNDTSLYKDIKEALGNDPYDCISFALKDINKYDQASDTYKGLVLLRTSLVQKPAYRSMQATPAVAAQRGREDELKQKEARAQTLDQLNDETFKHSFKPKLQILMGKYRALESEHVKQLTKKYIFRNIDRYVKLFPKGIPHQDLKDIKGELEKEALYDEYCKKYKPVVEMDVTQPAPVQNGSIAQAGPTEEQLANFFSLPASKR